MRIFKDTIITILMFFTLFPISFVFMPEGISSRLIVAFVGVIIVAISIITSKGIKINNNIRAILAMTFIISIWAFICSFILNNGKDLTYVKHPYTILIMYLSAFATITVIKRFYKYISYELVTKFFIYTIILQSVIAVAQFFNLNLAEYLTSLQRLSERQMNIAESHFLAETRFIGFGLMFYTASFFYGTALVLIAFALRYRSINTGQIVVYIILYLLVFFIGMGLSRSTIFGLASSLLILVFPLKTMREMILILIKSFLTFGLLAIILLFAINYFPNLNESFSSLIDNAFDFVTLYINTGKLSSDSAAGTFDFFILPQRFETYLFGTGLYETYHSIDDFNYSDIGYLRLIYYFGIPGLILVIGFEIKLLKMAFRRNGLTPIYYAMLFLLLITNIKGLTTLAIISFLYLLIPNNQIKQLK